MYNQNKCIHVTRTINKDIINNIFYHNEYNKCN